MPNDLERLRRQHRLLTLRAKGLRAIREFFHARDFLEVETPVRLLAPAMELHIEAQPAGDAYFLRTSPELHMKRLLAAGYERIFQMGPCFRAGERGERHHPEYTMLEWYRANADYMDILDDTQALLRHLANRLEIPAPLPYDPNTLNLTSEWTILPVQEAFQRWVGWDPVTNYDADRFDLDLVEKIEPALATLPVPVVLKDYPAAAAALARRKPDNPAVAERWELYLAGMEIANAYSELTDAAEQRARFAECAAARTALGARGYPIDEEFLAALPTMPPSGGIALGVDRLIMIMGNARTIGDVTAFQE